MRRWIWTLVILAVLAAAYWTWPFVGAAGLASAAQRGDSAAVIERVDLPALRRSLARQIALAYLEATGKGGKAGSFGRSLMGAAATTVADPYVAELLTPENITAMIGRGKIGTVKLGDKDVAVNRDLPGFADLLHGDWLSMLTGSYFDGIASFVIPAEVKGAAADNYAVHLRLDGLTWRLSGIDLPASMVDQIARSILARNGGTPATQ